MGAISSSTKYVIEMGKMAMESGADGIIVTGPSWYNGIKIELWRRSIFSTPLTLK